MFVLLHLPGIRSLRLAETAGKRNSPSPLDLELGLEAWYCQGSPRGGACCELSRREGTPRDGKSTDNNYLAPWSQLHLQQALSLDYTTSEPKLGFFKSQFELGVSHLPPRVLTNPGSKGGVYGRRGS